MKRTLTTLILTMCLTAIAFAQSNEGTSFWCTFMPHVDALLNQKVIMITSKYNTKGELRAEGVGLIKKFNVIANVATIIKVNETIELVEAEKITNQGIHIMTDLPSTVYIHQFSDFRSEASIVLPESALGHSYYTMSYIGRYSRNQVFPSQFSIVGVKDNTKVMIVPSTATKTGYAASQPFVITLNRGQTYLVQAAKENDDLTASYIEANKEVAVFSGNPWTGVPQDCGNWDNLLEQMIPIHAWGKKVATVPSAFNAYDLYRVLASEDNTSIQIDGQIIGLNRGQYYEFQSNKSTYIQADKAIMVAQYLIGGKCSGHPIGDPSMLILNSTEQNRDTIIIYNSDLQSITENYINIIVHRDDIENTTIDGLPINTFAIVQDTIPLSPLTYLTLKVNYGSHTLINQGCGIIATAYGYGFAESYAYGGGANFRPINVAPIIEGACVEDSAFFDAGLDSMKVKLFWSFGDGATSTKLKPSHKYNATGNYDVSLIVENVCLEIRDTFQKSIYISNKRQLWTSSDTLICLKDSLRLYAKDDSINARYIWQFPDGTQVEGQSISIASTTKINDGLYSVKGILRGCDTPLKQINVEIRPLPPIDLGKDTTYCEGDQSFQISIPNYDYIEWHDGFQSTNYTITSSGTKSVLVEDQYGCANKDSMEIISFCPTEIYLPNVFSPNGDNINDFFEVIGKGITTYKLNIYDRWGSKIYSGPRWDGSHNGQKVSIGVYVYVISYDDMQVNGITRQAQKTGQVLVIY